MVKAVKLLGNPLQGTVLKANAIPGNKGGFFCVMDLPRFTVVHADDDFILGLVLDFLFNLMAGISAARGTGDGQQGFARSLANLIPQQATGHAASNSTTSRTSTRSRLAMA